MKVRIVVLVLVIGAVPLRGADAWIQMNGGYNSETLEGWGEVVADGAVFVWKGMEYLCQGGSKVAIGIFKPFR